VTGTGEIERLVRRLDDRGEDAMDARAELTYRGREIDVMAPLLRVLPTLTRYGQLCAIEIIEELGDARAEMPLVDLLTSEHDTVREWAAIALGEMGFVDAVPALQRAYQACKDRGTPPDWSEPAGFRFALTELGARHPITPPLTASLRTTTPNGVQLWPLLRVFEVFDDLAAHDQVVLYFQLWSVEPHGGMYDRLVPDTGAELDFDQPWSALVQQAHRRATANADQATIDDNVVATIQWINEGDV
jgi:hypothetical protein